MRYHISGVGTYDNATLAAQVVRPLWNWNVLAIELRKLNPLPDV